MNKRRSVVWVLVSLSAIALAGGIFASNMGFKQPYLLLGAGPGSATGTNLIALPYWPQIGMDSARDLWNDISNGGTMPTTIQRHVRATDTFQLYTFGTADFPLVAGESLFVTMPPGASDNYLCVGSHDPARQITLLSASSPLSRSGTNAYAHPYHGTSTTARALFQEIGTAALIQRFARATNTFQVYTFGTVDFPLTPCEGLFVTVSADTTFVPGHF